MASLEHFYYGQLVHYGEPTGERRIVARSANVSEDMISAATRSAMLPARPNTSMSTWAIVRGGKAAPFIMVQSGIGAAGQEMRHLIFLSSDNLRDLQGNLSLLATLLDEELPTYEMIADIQPPLDLPTDTQRTLDDQTDDILTLMSHTGNNTRNLEPLLSAIVQGVPLIVMNAPTSSKTRTEFVQGLVTLLPSSTRFSVTFATYRQLEDGINTQISFMDQAPPGDALIYKWDDRSVSGTELKDDYSHYITSQLRLDITHALQQADGLTQVAGWRFRSGDKLAEALAYASKRLRLDNALTNNMPVDLAEASDVLADDPTLTPELQYAYAEHLVNFALAMNEMDQADPVAPLLKKDESIANMVVSKLDEAIQSSQGTRVFNTLARWMSRDDGPDGEEWVNLMQLSTIAAMQELVTNQDTEGLNTFLDGVRQADPKLKIGRYTPQIIQTVVPLASHDANLGVRLLALAMMHLPDEQFNRLMESDTFRRHLTGPVTRYLEALRKPGKQEAPLLVTAAESLGNNIKPIALRRLTELAYNQQRLDLIDTPALAELLRLALSDEGKEHNVMLATVVSAVNAHQLQALIQPGPRYILQILLALGRYDLLARAMIDQSRDLYPGEGQYEFIRMVQEFVAKTPLPAETVPEALRGLEANGIKGVTMIAVAAGALESTRFAPELKGLAQRLVKQIDESQAYKEVIQPEVVITLIRYYGHHDATSGVNAATNLMPDVAAARDNKEGLAAINKTFQMLWKTEEYKSIAYNMLRQYIRIADDVAARRVVEYFGKELGSQRAHQLGITYRFSQFMGNVDVTIYTEVLGQVADVLESHAQLYEDDELYPSHRVLSTYKQSLYSNLNLDERRQLGQDYKKIAETIAAIGQDYERHSKRGTRYTDTILKGTADPRSVVDVLHAAGGYLAQGRYYRLKLRAGSGYDILEASQTKEVTNHVGLAAELLSSMLETWKPSDGVVMAVSDLKSELDSILRQLPREEMREIRDKLAADWQRLAELIIHIFDKADRSALDPGSRLGRELDSQKRLPESAVEFYRMMYSFFLGS
ncbi:MAG: hypothetical protein KC708_11715 [Anaerolineae bacterium]|nr:hypothetical protein [Anaerolineae bacterium]